MSAHSCSWVQQYAAQGALTQVSYEAYDLGWNSNLVWNGFTRVSDDVKQAGLVSLPMITTVNLDKMRQLWANPQPFIAAALAEAKQWQYDGYNIDVSLSTLRWL